MELSSYQLETAPEISPTIGIWTNLTPDHLERHKTLETYSHIKRRLLENSETCIYNGDDEFLKQHRAKSKQGIWVSTKKGDSSKWFSWIPSAENPREQFYSITKAGAWIGIGLLAIVWIVVRFVGPAAGWWVPADVR